MTVKYDASLQEYNTFGVKAQAKVMASFKSTQDLKMLLVNKDFEGLPRLILGGGSNLLFTRDFPGLVLKNEILGIECINEDSDHFYIKVGAGENWHEFVLHCINNNWAGLENLSLIPGNVGASPMQNIGAYGVEIKDRFHSLEAFNLKTLETETFDRESCKFGYRESVFKNIYKDKYIIISVTFKLLKEPDLNTSYGAIESELERRGISNPGIKDVSDVVIHIRNTKLPNPAELGNAGSFFKNPVVSKDTFDKLSSEYPEMPHYPLNDGMIKLAAGWLIEQAGWKGKRVGNCGMHEKQALVLVNYGNASGEEIYEHSESVLTSVEEKFGISLEREVNIIR
jgi:UDP-N-acetylmuramate dehydrogenase